MVSSIPKNIFRWIKSAAGLSILLAIVLAIVAGIDRGPYVIINTIITGGMLAIVSMGLALVFGVMNVAQFAHGEYFMIGTLVAYYTITPLQSYLQQNPNPVLALIAPLIAIFGSLIVGLIAGVFTEKLIFYPLRKRSRSNWVMNSFLVTVGISVMLINGHQLLFGSNIKGIVRYWNGRPLSFMDLFVSRDRVMALVIAAVVVVAFTLFMKYSRIGSAIRCVSQDETGAQMIGINQNAIQVLTMSLSCGLAAIAGSSLLFIYPSYPTVGLEPLYMAWFVVILAGLGNIPGAVVCSFIVALLKTLTVEYIGTGWDFVVPTAVIMVMLVIKPSGIFGSEVRGVLNE